MDVLRLVIEASPETVIDVTTAIATEQDYEVAALGPHSISIKKGSLSLSYWFRLFTAYCDFVAIAEPLREGVCQLTFLRSVPHWAGMMSVDKVRWKSAKLLDGIRAGFRARGVKCSDM